MSWTEELKKQREEFWKEKISDIKGIIEETVKSHLETNEYALTGYGFNVFAKRIESAVIRIQVCFKIGDEEIEIASFQNGDAAIVCVLMLAEKLEEEGFEIIDTENDKVDFYDLQNHMLCEGVIPVS